MNVGKLRAKIRKLHEDFEDEEMEAGELNLVPYLDIVTNVIMFLMITTATASAVFKNINVSSPAIGTGGGEATDQQQQDLNLTVQISDRGFTVAASGAVLPGADGKLPTIPKPADRDYDYDALTRKIREIKDTVARPDESKVIINANPEIIYEILVNTMDAIRSDAKGIMFNDVLLSAGIS